jgi:hypothetical protein
MRNFTDSQLNTSMRRLTAEELRQVSGGNEHKHITVNFNVGGTGVGGSGAGGAGGIVGGNGYGGTGIGGPGKGDVLIGV